MQRTGLAPIDYHAEAPVFFPNKKESDAATYAQSKTNHAKLSKSAEELQACGTVMLENGVPIRSDARQKFCSI